MNPLRKALFAGGFVAATITGGVIGASLLGTANAQSGGDTATTVAPSDQSSGQSTSPTPPADHPRHDPSQGGHTANGITEQLLTGDTKTQAETAATAAVPNATIERVETDAEGATYEAHMVKSDGSHVTVKLNADFSVASIENN